MSTLTHWNPFRALERREDVFDDFMREFFGKAGRDEVGFAPPVEVAEAEKDVTVTMAVPGVEKDALHIAVDDRVLTVRGEHRKESEEKKREYHRQEIHYGSFVRSVGLPAEVDAGTAEADLKNGMLKIRLPKTANPKERRIQVKTA
ncbi:MAG: Hsp20/alpha crystallin family protein [Deltaproteobacteria bacterium]|nr:Hsp20/alpha crystallin family protein [Deltaproteobacteria bacterium]